MKSDKSALKKNSGKETFQESSQQTKEIASKVLNKITNLFDIYIRATSQDEITVTDVCFSVVQHIFKLFPSSGLIDRSQTRAIDIEEVYYCEKIIDVLESKLVQHLSKNSEGQAKRGQTAMSFQQVKRQFVKRMGKLLNDSLEFGRRISAFLDQQMGGKWKSQESEVQRIALQSEDSIIQLLIEKVKNTKKIYLEEKKMWEQQRVSLSYKIQEEKQKYLNLKNKRDQILQDMNEIEELIERNQMESVHDIIQRNNRYSQSFYRPQHINPIQSTKNINCEEQEHGQPVVSHKGTEESEISEIHKQELSLKKENEFLKEKVQQLRKQLYRAVCTISFLNKASKKGKLEGLDKIEKKSNILEKGEKEREGLKKKQSSQEVKGKPEKIRTPIFQQLQKNFETMGLKSFY